MENNEVIRRFNERDEIAFKLIFNALYPGLVKWSGSIIKDYHESEDVVIVVFTKLWKSDKQLYSFDSIRQYMYQAVKHESINYTKSVRSRKREIDELIDEDIPDYTEAPSGLIEKILDKIDELPAHYKNLLILDLKGYSDKEISSMTGHTINKIDVYKWRAKQILKSLLNK